MKKKTIKKSAASPGASGSQKKAKGGAQGKQAKTTNKNKTQSSSRKAGSSNVYNDNNYAYRPSMNQRGGFESEQYPRYGREIDPGRNAGGYINEDRGYYGRGRDAYYAEDDRNLYGRAHSGNRAQQERDYPRYGQGQSQGRDWDQGQGYGYGYNPSEEDSRFMNEPRGNRYIPEEQADYNHQSSGRGSARRYNEEEYYPSSRMGGGDDWRGSSESSSSSRRGSHRR